MRRILWACGCAAWSGLCVLAAAAAEPADNPAPPVSPWNAAEQVFAGRLDAVKAGPVGLSFPPLRTYQLTFTAAEIFRGDVAGGAPVTANYSVRQEAEPVFPAGEVCLVAATRARGGLRVEMLEPMTQEQLAAVKLETALPLGWRVAEGDPLSPWASLPDYVWPEGAMLDADHACAETGRPAALAGPKAEFHVEKVPPAREVEFANPDGDGEYRITVKNPTDAPLTVPALLTDGEEILWSESLLIVCQQRAYVCPGAAGAPASVESATLEPGESVSTVVNVLRLRGPEWPQGGYRIEFQFCLGEKSVTQSFYYLSRHHDPLREAAQRER